MQRIIILFLLGISSIGGVIGQEVRFELRDTLLVSGAPTVIPVEVYNFESVVSFQFSIGWDSTLTLQDAQFDLAFESGLVINTFDHHINISWLGPFGGLSLPDGATFANLLFDTRGCPGDSASVGLTQEFIPWEVGVVDDGNLSLGPPDTLPNLTTWRAPQILPFQDTLICEGNSLFVTAGCDDCVEFAWEAGGDGASIEIDTAGIFPLTAISENDCLFQDSLVVDVDTFQLEVLRDTILCPEDSIQFVLPDTLSAYTWSTGETAASITAFSGGLYSVTVTNINGCNATDEAAIDAENLPMGIPFADPPTLCPGDSTLLTLDTASVETVQWLDANGRLIAFDSIAIRVSPDSTQAYSVISTNGCGADTAVIDIELIVFEGNAGQDTCIAEGASVELNATGGDSYRWIEREYPVTPANIPNPVVQPADSSWFVVEITGEGGCVIVDSVFVEVATNPLATIRPINLITPNGDGMNDQLFFPNLMKFPDNELTVWSRWGQPVYQKSGYQQDDELWEGTHNGQPLPDGEYFYLLEVNGERIQQTLSIIRE
ncbi:MAG: gliding motility-associated C-terminal domain-containing protein [bacterium]|jgi:gliding motility-associated-like protein|nr:gliding motility-associated C-terminal domain-containing protein [bacterium]